MQLSTGWPRCGHRARVTQAGNRFVLLDLFCRVFAQLLWLSCSPCPSILLSLFVVMVNNYFGTINDCDVPCSPHSPPLSFVLGCLFFLSSKNEFAPSHFARRQLIISQGRGRGVAELRKLHELLQRLLSNARQDVPWRESASKQDLPISFITSW